MLINFRGLCRHLAAPVAALVFVSSMMPVQVAQAEMIATDRVLESIDGADQRTKVQDFLAREDVREKLQSMGVDPREAAARVDSMSGSEIARLAQVIEQDPAGAGIEGVIGALLLVFIILLITDILGFAERELRFAHARRRFMADSGRAPRERARRLRDPA